MTPRTTCCIASTASCMCLVGRTTPLQWAQTYSWSWILRRGSGGSLRVRALPNILTSSPLDRGSTRVAGREREGRRSTLCTVMRIVWRPSWQRRTTHRGPRTNTTIFGVMTLPRTNGPRCAFSGTRRVGGQRCRVYMYV